MRRWIIFVWFWLSVWATLRAQTLVHSGQCDSGGLSCTIVINPVTTGNTVICAEVNSSGGTNSFSDNHSGTYSTVINNARDNDPSSQCAGFCTQTSVAATIASTTASYTFTCTVSSAIHTQECVCAEYSGLPATFASDPVVTSPSFGTFTGVDTLVSSGAGSTTFTNELLVGVAAWGESTQPTNRTAFCNAGTGFTQRQNVARGGIGSGICYLDRNASTIGSYTASATLLAGTDPAHIKVTGGIVYLIGAKSSTSASGGVRHRAVSY